MPPDLRAAERLHGTGGLSCRSFGAGAPFVCASDTVPMLCGQNQTGIDDDVGDLASCRDAQTLSAVFESPTNATRGHELQSCANGCQATVQNGITIDARCL